MAGRIEQVRIESQGNSMLEPQIKKIKNVRKFQESSIIVVWGGFDGSKKKQEKKSNAIFWTM